MKSTGAAEAPIACSLEAGELRERLAWIAELNRAALLGIHREGLRLVLTYRRDHAEHVREMVRRERRCCGFLRFDLMEDQNGVTLTIQAPQATDDALDAIFEPFLPASPQSGGCADATTTVRNGGTNDGC